MANRRRRKRRAGGRRQPRRYPGNKWRRRRRRADRAGSAPPCPARPGVAPPRSVMSSHCASRVPRGPVRKLVLGTVPETRGRQPGEALRAVCPSPQTPRQGVEGRFAALSCPCVRHLAFLLGWGRGGLGSWPPPWPLSIASPQLGVGDPHKKTQTHLSEVEKCTVWCDLSS